MWTTTVFVLGVFALIVTRTAGQNEVDLTGADCSENSTLVQTCNNYFNYYYGSGTVEDNCRLLLETVACIETAMCHCNFSGDHPHLEQGYRTNMVLLHYFNNLTQCGNQTFGDSIQSDVIGPIDIQEGVNCTQYNKTAGDLSLSLAVAQIPLVQDVVAICPAVEDCYNQYDRGLELALFRKQWPEFCQESVVLLECLINVTCDCGMATHELVVNLVVQERTIYRDNCASIIDISSFVESGVSCPGVSVCESLDPRYNCLVEFESAASTSLTYLAYCTALSNLANCTEELACDCGFYQEPTYYRSLAIIKHNYINATYCEPITGPFPTHSGLDCGVDNRFTEAEKILTISLEEVGYTPGEEASCPGLRDCYVTAQAKSSEAHRMKDLTAICVTEAERVTCLEEAYCACGKLHDDDVYDKIYALRLNQGNLCNEVADFPPLIRCRGLSTCLHHDPLRICEAEYAYDSAIAGEQFNLQCQASKSYITCTEEVGCACGLLDDGTSLAAETVYNFTTLSLRIYDKAGCPRLIGDIIPNESGIECEGHVPDDTTRRLVLAYADSSEVAALARDCQVVRACFHSHDSARADALMRRNYDKLCRVQRELVLCVEKAYCVCGMTGMEGAENYITTQIRTHDAFCAQIAPINRQTCTRAVAALSAQCGGVSGCFGTYDRLMESSTRTRCQVQTTLIGCLDAAYCQCSLNGTASAEHSITREITAYTSQLCGPADSVVRVQCRGRITGAADSIHLSLSLLLMFLISAIVVP